MPRRFLLVILIAAACRPSAPPVTPAPSATPAPSVAPASGLTSAPDGWQLMDESADHVPGISVGKARRELLAGKTPKTVLVAVIGIWLIVYGILAAILAFRLRRTGSAPPGPGDLAAT